MPSSAEGLVNVSAVGLLPNWNRLESIWRGMRADDVPSNVASRLSVNFFAQGYKLGSTIFHYWIHGYQASSTVTGIIEDLNFCPSHDGDWVMSGNWTWDESIVPMQPVSCTLHLGKCDVIDKITFSMSGEQEKKLSMGVARNGIDSDVPSSYELAPTNGCSQ